MRIFTKISCLWLCLGFTVSLMSMQSTVLKNNLKQLHNALNVLENKLKKDIKPEKEELNLSKLDKETLEILLAELERRGIPFHEFVREELSKTTIQPQGEPESQTPVTPGGPPPPPPPAPAVAQVSGGIVVGAPPLPSTTEKPQEGGKPPSLEAILKQRKALSKTGLAEATLEEQKRSDEQFLTIFRDSKDIDEIIDKLTRIKENPLYLKKEMFKEKVKTPLPKGGLSEGLKISKIDIIPLLRRKSHLIFNFFNKNYLKDYLYHPNLFTENDYEHLSNLINIAQEGKKIPIVDRKLISDMFFLNAFRQAISIDEIIQNLEGLASNEQYLKRESFKAALKLPIQDLLKKKSKLIEDAMQPGSVYLKDYLFDISLFNDDDYNALIKLLNE